MEATNLVETFDMPIVSSEFLLKEIEQQIQDGDMTPFLVLGLSGIGKTQGMSGLAKKLNIGYKNIRLVNHDNADVTGVPYITENKTTAFATTDMFPMVERDGERGILVLDEITSCKEGLRTAVNQLLEEERSIGEYHLPDGWVIVCLGNGPDDGGNFDDLKQYTVSRCQCYRMEPDFKAWKKWAVAAGINPSILAFLAWSPDNFYCSAGGQDAMEGTMLACPRSWHNASNKLTRAENHLTKGTVLDRSVVEIQVGSLVGRLSGTKFAAFYDLRKQMVSIEDILDGKNPALDKRLGTEVQYITTESLAWAVNKELGNASLTDVSKDDRTLARVGNAIDWLLAVSNTMLDMTVNGFSTLAMNPTFVTILAIPPVQLQKSIDKVDEFMEAHKVVFAYN